MNEIPSSVEVSLLEAGFTAMEVMILRRLLEHHELTLRELAARTGKSTGALDQGVKKLLRKDIIKKETINGAIKFTLISLEAVRRWMDDDVRRKREMLARRHQNFEAFIQSVEHDKTRPEIRYFDGLDGLAQAYRALLDYGKELLMFVPAFCPAEDDPLHDFKVEWVRSRRKLGVFSRVVTHDTPFGRRYHTRDPLEYRRSVLVDEEQYPFTFEKIICGDTVACFNVGEKRACLLRYPEMAAMEQGLFESIWKRAAKNVEAWASTVPASPSLTTATLPAASQRATSWARPLRRCSVLALCATKWKERWGRAATGSTRSA